MHDTDERRAKILQKVRDLQPGIRAAADDIEANRELPRWLVEKLLSAGVFGLGLPKAIGGLEADPLLNISVIEELSRADGSVGWCAMIGSGTGLFMSTLLDPATLREVFSDPNTISGGFYPPLGMATASDNGYSVSGRFPFCSGIRHATVLVSGCVTVEANGDFRLRDGESEWRVACLPKSACRVRDTWYSTGLRGTGSNDYEVDNYLTPAELTACYKDGPKRDEALYRFPAMYLANMAGVPLGVGRGALDAAHRIIEEERPALREVSDIQSAIARAEGLVGSARSYVCDTMGSLWETILRGDAPGLQANATYRLAITHAYLCAGEATRILYDAFGGLSVYRRHNLDRPMRDLYTMLQHASVGKKSLESEGRVLLGLEGGTLIL